MGRLVTNNIYNAGLRPVIEEGLKDLGIDQVLNQIYLPMNQAMQQRDLVLNHWSNLL